VTAVALHQESCGPDDGPVLLMGGSLGTTLAMWEPQLPALSARHRVVRFDHRGHGGSPVPDGPYSLAGLGGDVLALMDRLGVRRASYCGLSLGGMVGQWLAINAPQRIERLVVICTSPYLPPADGWRQRAATVRQAGSCAAVADTVLPRWFTPGWSEAHPDVVARLRTMIASIAAEGYAGCCEAIAEMDLREGLASIAAPTMVIAGRQDPATPPEQGASIAHAVPRARFEVLDPGAHLASVERSDDVTRLIAEHLSTTGADA
jgi:3-oxoadipate enol-lactonase